MENFKNLFLASNTMDGFVSHFDDFHNSRNGWYNYIIKGGPGTGKSTAMKNIAKKLDSLGENVIVGPCSSDPDSLDAVILPKHKIIVTDGTAPHVLEPKFVGACDKIVNFGDAFNFDKLYNDRHKIIEISDKISTLYSRIYKYTKVLGTLYSDIEKLSEKSVDYCGAKNQAMKLCKKYIPLNDKKGTSQGCFLSALTHKGYITFFGTVEKSADKVIALCDEYGVVSDIFINEIIKSLNKSGYDYYVAYNPLKPQKAEHIIVPQLKLAFVTKSRLFDYDLPCKKIHLKRFIDLSVLSENKEKINFNRHAISKITEKTVFIMKEAKKEHDSLESLYSPAVDFSKIDKITEDTFKSIKKRITD